MRDARRLLFALALGCVGHASGASAQASASSEPPETGARVVRPPEATACRHTADCIVSAIENESPTGPCCRVCNGREALSRAWAAQRTPCDSRKRGMCPTSCATSLGAGPLAACVAGRCFLDYPSLEDHCASDSDCGALPKLSTSVAADGCRLTCGEYVAANRYAAGAVTYLYQEPSASGTCQASCVDPIPDAACRSGHCALVDAVAFDVTDVTASPPTITGPLPAVDVQSVVFRNAAHLAHCAEQPRRLRRQTSFAFTLEFVIGADGLVVGVDTQTIAHRFPDIAACISAEVSRWPFARPIGGRTVRVSYPLLLAFVMH